MGENRLFRNLGRASKCKLIRQFLKGWSGNSLFCKEIMIVKSFYSFYGSRDEMKHFIGHFCKLNKK